MKKIFVLLAIILTMAVNSYAEPILTVQENIDLGVINEDLTFQQETSIRNSGDSDLILGTVSSSCSCIQIIQPKNSITVKPLQDFKIKFSVDPRGYIGKVSKSIYIFSNDVENRMKRVNVAFEVNKDEEKIVSRFQGFSIPVIISVGLADGVNPCAFSVIVFFISFLAFRGYQKKYLVFAGSSFLLGVFITYLLIGLGLFHILQSLAVFELISTIIYFVIVALAIFLGIVSLWDYVQYKKTGDFDSMKLKLPRLFKDAIHKTIQSDFRSQDRFKNLSSIALVGLASGFIVSILESICTGQMYLPTIAYIFKNTELKLDAFLLLLLYNFCFIIPLVVIFILGLFGVNSEAFAKFMQRHIGLIKISTALLFFILGVYLIIVKLNG